MSNEVEIDPAALAAEADAAVGDAPVLADQASPMVEGGPPVESWGPLVRSLTPTLRIVVFPQWEITDEEAGEVEASLSECLDMAFPGGMSGRYACWARLLLASAGIVAGRAIQNGGKLPPLGPKRVLRRTDEKEAGTGAAPEV